MRTTLTLEDDVAAAIERLRAARGDSMKRVVNEALRAGLADLEAVDDRPRSFTTDPVSHGASRIGDLRDVSEALAIAEDGTYR